MKFAFQILYLITEIQLKSSYSLVQNLDKMGDWADDTDDVPKATNWADVDEVPEPVVTDDGQYK